MVSEGWEMATNWWEDAVLHQEQCDNNVEAQMSNISVIHMLFILGLARIQDGGKIPTGSHYIVVTFQMQIKDSLSSCRLLLSYIYIIYKSKNTLQQ